MMGFAVRIAEKVPKLDRLRELARALGEVIYGMTIYEMVRELNKARASLEHLFILTVFGDLLGVPILPPYYSLRLLPYIVPTLDTWRRSMLRERDFTDLLDQELG
jgi:hypothetical protein